MNWLKKLLGIETRAAHPLHVAIVDPEWSAKRAAFKSRLASTPANDPLLVGVLGWHDQMLAEKIRKCDNATLTPEEALSLCHQIAQIAAFRTELDELAKAERAKVQQLRPT